MFFYLNLAIQYMRIYTLSVAGFNIGNFYFAIFFPNHQTAKLKTPQIFPLYGNTQLTKVLSTGMRTLAKVWNCT